MIDPKFTTLLGAAMLIAATVVSLPEASAQETGGGHGPDTGMMRDAAGSHGGSGQGYYGAGHDILHYWYQTLKQPGTGMSCCNNQDCRPTNYRMIGNDVQVEVDGEWTTVPPNKILNVQPPDLNAHVCAPKQKGLYPKGHVFCVVLGSGV